MEQQIARASRLAVASGQYDKRTRIAVSRAHYLVGLTTGRLILVSALSLAIGVARIDESRAAIYPDAHNSATSSSKDQSPGKKTAVKRPACRLWKDSHHKHAKPRKHCVRRSPKRVATPPVMKSPGPSPLPGPPMSTGVGASPLPSPSPVADAPLPTAPTVPIESKLPADPVPVQTPSPFRFFAPTSFWNEALSSDASLDPSSPGDVAAFDREVVAEEAEGGPNIDAARWSVPVYTVSAAQATVRVKIVGGSTVLQAAWDAVPLPANAHAAPGTDKHLVVWRPSTNELWEFWRLEKTTTGWQAWWGGAMRNVSSNPGVYGPEAWPGATAGWGGSASSLSLAGGLITLEDLELGKINHALAIAIPKVRAGVYASPAQRDDGVSNSALSLPEGAHLRLDPALDLGALHLPHLTLMLAEAAQKYGIFVRSEAANIALYSQDPVSTGTEPYAGPNGYFEGKYPNELLASFPWSHLQLLKMNLHSDR
jgi:hypothetical protein